MGIYVGGFGEFGRGFGQINNAGIKLLDWAVGKRLPLMIIYVKKWTGWLITLRLVKLKQWLITFL